MVAAIMLFSPQVMACSCNIPPLNQAYIDKTPYIALVKIDKMLDSTFKQANFGSFQVKVSEILRYKGTKQEKLLVSGGARKFNYWTSCDLGVEEGQEWLVFGYVGEGGMITMQSCNYTVMYRAANGLREWLAHGGFTALNFLNKYYKINDATKNILLGETKLATYPNGLTELSIPYKKGFKQGTARYYYPNGKIFGEVNYAKDSLNGRSTWYFPDGKVQNKATYKMGKPIDTCAYYIETGEPWMIFIYSKTGEIKKSFMYQGPEVRYLSSETIYANGKSSHTIYYREEDHTKRKIDYHTPDGEVEEDYDSNGRLTRTRYFDKAGKLYKTDMLPYFAK